MEIEIEIDATDPMLAFSLMGSAELSAEQAVTVPGGISLTYQGESLGKSEGQPHIIWFIATITAPVVAEVFASWLCGKVKGRAKKLSINRKEIDISEGEITRIVEEIITLE